jgi:autotransporter-associated beta strand protein
MWSSLFFACAVLTAPALHVAESLVVDLDVADLTLNNNDYVRSWVNDGSAAGVFTNLIAGKGPLYQTSVGGAPAVTFQAYNADSMMTNMAPIPATICGADTWSMEAWVYNPSLSGTEVVFSWTARNKWPAEGSRGSCFEFRYGSDTGNAFEHYANNVPWYTGPLPGVVPATGAWHYVACTRDAEGRERVYVDGQMRTLTTPQEMRIRTDGIYTLGCVRDYAQTNLNAYSAWVYPFSGSISKLRVHDGTLSEGQVYDNYQEERGDFAVADVSDSVWAASPTNTAAWEDPASWAGGVVPAYTSRVWIANGATAVVNTALGEIGRFLPIHGGLILSNNASLTATPWQNNHVYMGNYSNNVFNLAIREGTFTVMDYTNSSHLYFGVNRGQAYGVIGGGAGPAVLDSGRDVQIGVGDGSVADLVLETGGSLYTSNGWIYVGVSGASDAKVTVNGGTIGHRTPSKDLIIGHNKAIGVLEINSGLVAPSQDIQLTRDMASGRCTGIIQLNGGVVEARRIYPEETNQGTNMVCLNGGTIRNRDSRTDFLQSLDWAYVQPGGAMFEIIPGTAITVGQSLLSDPNLGDGGLTKFGNGTLTLSGANTITGGLSVAAGHLYLSNASGLPTGYASPVTLSAGASIGYNKVGGANELLALMPVNSPGGIVLYENNAAEDLDLSAYPNLGVSFASGVTYTGTYTPYNQNYLFTPVGTGNVYAPLIAEGAGTATVTVNGEPAGTLELTGDNAYTGGTTINGGMLVMGHVNALGDPAVVTIPDIGIYNGAALKLNAAGIPATIVTRIKPDSQGYIILGANYTGINLDLTGLPGIKIGTDQANHYYSGVITPEGDVYRTGGGRVSYASGNYGLVLTNLIDNGATPRTLVVDGNGMVRPAGTYNNYSGGTVVSNSGALHLREDSGLGKVPAEYDPDNVYVNNGVFRPGSTSFSMNAKRGLTVGPDSMTLHPNGSQTFTMLGSLHGSGAITNTDSGTVVLGGTSNTYSGAVTLRTGSFIVGNGGNFTWNTNATVNGFDGTFVSYYNGDLAWSTAFGSPLGVGGWPYLNFRKTGSGTLTMDVSQVYTRNTTIDNGTLKSGVLDGIPSGHNRGNVTVNNLNYVPPAKLDVNGYDIILNGLYGAGVITDSLATATSVTVGDNNQWSRFNGKVSQNLVLSKVGTGLLELMTGTEAHDASVSVGNLTMWPSSVVAGNLNLMNNCTLNIGTNRYEMDGLLGEYFDFSNTALRKYATVTSLVSLATFTEVLAPFAPATIAISSVSNVFSFGSTGALFQNKGDYRVGRWTGKFLAETDGEYGFNTLSDDGSMVFINGELVVSNNFSQGYTTVNPKKLFPITLTKGWHDILVAYYNGTGGYGLTVFMTPPGGVEAELPQSLLRPPAVQVGTLTGGMYSYAWFYTHKDSLTLGNQDDASFEGRFTGTNALMAIEKVGTGSQTLKRVSFLGEATVQEGTLALQGSPMIEGAVQSVSGTVSVAQGAVLSARSYSPDWPNAGFAGAYHEIPGFNAATFASLPSIYSYFDKRQPTHLLGTYLAGDYVKMDPYTLFPTPFNGAYMDFQALYQAKFVAREAGTFGFYLNSDDRSDLYLAGVQVITNVTSTGGKSGTIDLTAGTHDILVPFQQGGGGYRFYMNVTPPGGTNGTLPNAMLRPCVAQTGPLNSEDGATVALPDMGSFLRVNETADTVAAGVFAGVEGAEVEKAGAARLTLTGDNAASYLGNWFISQGELWAGDGATNGTLGGSNVYISGGAALVFNRSDDITYGGSIAGKGEIRSAGTGKVKMAGNMHAFQGTIQVGEGQDISLANTLVATNALIVNNGTFRILGGSMFLEAARITGTGAIGLEQGATLSLGLTDADFGKSLWVSNGVLALAVTNTPSDWSIDRLTIEAGTALEVCSSGLCGRFYDVPSGDAGAILSNAFVTFSGVTNYFAAKTPALMESTWLQGEGFDFGIDTSGTAGTGLFPGKYRKPAGVGNYNFAGFWQGKIRITEPGSYTFSTYSDDGSCIFINEEIVVNNAGSHGMQTRTGTVVLPNGLHDITICFQQGGGGYGLNAKVILPGETVARLLPNLMLVENAGDTPAYSLTVNTVAVTNGPGIGTVSFAGSGTLRMTDLWIDTGAKLAVTGGVACAGSALTVTMPSEVPYGITVVADFTGTDGLDVNGITLTSARPEADLRYRNKLLYLARSNGSMLILR